MEMETTSLSKRASSPEGFPEPGSISETDEEFDEHPNSIYDDLRMQGQKTRLITLCPGEFGSPLNITLCIADLDANPEYEALSYAWGDPHPARSVVVNTQRFEVTPNLYDALQRLRRKGACRTLWIDAICINQSDKAERGHQVGIMGQIYRQAVSVIVWLGEFYSEEAADFEDLTACCYCNKSPWCVCWISRCHHRRWTPVMLAYIAIQRRIADYLGDVRKAARILQRPVQRHKHFDGKPIQYPPSPNTVLDRIYSSSWWTRGWVLQEVLLSQHPPLAMFAANAIPLKVLTSSALQAFEAGKAPREIDTKSIRRLNSCLTGKPPSLSLSFALKLSTARTMSVRHDYVYGVLALVEESVRREITPEYSKSISQVYTETMRIMLRCEGLRSLEGVRKARAQTPFDLPSWVCDFSAKYGVPLVQYPRYERIKPFENDWEVLEINLVFRGEILGGTLGWETTRISLSDMEVRWEEYYSEQVRRSGMNYETSAGYFTEAAFLCRPGDELWTIDGLDGSLILSRIGLDDQNSDGRRWRQIVGVAHTPTWLFGRPPDGENPDHGKSFKVMLV